MAALPSRRSFETRPEMVSVEKERFMGWACSECVWQFNPSGRFSQDLGVERKRAVPGVSGRALSIATLVIGILKSMTRTIIDFYVNELFEKLHDFFKGSYFAWGDPTIKRAVVSQYRSVDFLNIGMARWERPIIHNTRS
jgi:hypothetical protein